MSQTTISPTLRRLIAEKSQNRCSYCQTQEDVAGTRFTVDHVIPEALGGATSVGNLCLACWDCNLAKQNRIVAKDPESGETVPLFHPNQQAWRDHFEWQAEGVLVVGRTAIGRATASALKLNRTLLIQARKRWIKAGWHPPQE